MGAIKKAKKRKAKRREITAKEEKSKAPLCLPTPPRYLPLAWGKAACLVAPQAWGNPSLPPTALFPHLLSRAQHIPTETMQKRRGERVHGAVERHGDHPGGTPCWRNPILEEPHPGGNPIPKPTPSWRKPHSSLLLLLLATSGSRGTGHGSPECHCRAPSTARPGCDVWSPPHLLPRTCPQPPNLALGSLGPAPANLLSGCLSKPIKTNH